MEALLRAAKDGWFLPVRSGRRTSWQLSPGFERFLDGGEEKIYGFAAVQPAWDRRWLLVMARVADINRAGRHLLETRLTWAGFGNPAPGVWLSTYPDRAGEAERVLRDAGVRAGAQIFLAEHVAGDNLSTLVSQAWDFDGLGREYEAFLTEFAESPPDDPLMRLARLVHAWRRRAAVGAASGRGGAHHGEGGGTDSQDSVIEGSAADAAVSAERAERAGRQRHVHPGAGVGWAVGLEPDFACPGVEAEDGAGSASRRGQLVDGKSAHDDVASRQVRVRHGGEAEVLRENVE